MMGTGDELKWELVDGLKDGTYDAGDLINPKQFTKLCRDESGNLVHQTFEVSGRKICLDRILKKLLERHKKQGLVRYVSIDLQKLSTEDMLSLLSHLEIPHNALDDEEDLRICLRRNLTQRHLILWVDHASVLNGGHLLITIKIIYDKRFYLTSEETQQKVDVQAIVEEPEVYIFARSRDTLEEKLSYCETRQEDMKILHLGTIDEDGTKICNIMRFTTGDHPALSVEAGQNIGGSWPCNGCQVPAFGFTDIEKCFRSPYRTLEQRRSLVRVFSF